MRHPEFPPPYTSGNALLAMTEMCGERSSVAVERCAARGSFLSPSMDEVGMETVKPRCRHGSVSSMSQRCSGFLILLLPHHSGCVAVVVFF